MTAPTTEPMAYTDPTTARRLVDAIASMSKIGEDPAHLGREMLLPTLPDRPPG